MAADLERQKMIEALLDLLHEDDFKDNLLKEINEEVDIPIIGEKKEGKIFKALYKILLKPVKKKLL